MRYDRGMPTLEIQGVRHCYDWTGSPESDSTLVFLHGWLLSRHYWQPLADCVGQAYRCLTYDLRGFGDSLEGLTPNSSYSLESYAQDLCELIEALNLRNVWLVGHSLGASIALWAAYLAPHRVHGVICINAGGGIYAAREFAQFRRLGQWMVEWRHPWLAHLPGMGQVFGQTGAIASLSQRWRNQRLQDFLKADRQAALGTLLQSTTEAAVHQLPQVVSQLKQPSYFIAGARDAIMHPRYVHHLASFHPMFQANCGGNLIELPDCGHLAMLEQTRQLEVIVRDILALHTTPRPLESLAMPSQDALSQCVMSQGAMSQGAPPQSPFTLAQEAIAS